MQDDVLNALRPLRAVRGAGRQEDALREWVQRAKTSPERTRRMNQLNGATNAKKQVRVQCTKPVGSVAGAVRACRQCAHASRPGLSVTRMLRMSTPQCNIMPPSMLLAAAAILRAGGLQPGRVRRSIQQRCNTQQRMRTKARQLS